MSNILDKYMQKARKQQEAGLPSGDACEYCSSAGTRNPSKYQAGQDVCSKCGAVMPALSGEYLFGVPVLVIDLKEVHNHIYQNSQYIGTALVFYPSMKVE